MQKHVRRKGNTLEIESIIILWTIRFEFVLISIPVPDTAWKGDRKSINDNIMHKHILCYSHTIIATSSLMTSFRSEDAVLFTVHEVPLLHSENFCTLAIKRGTEKMYHDNYSHENSCDN